MTELSNEENIKAFSAVPRQIVESIGEEGDLVRQHLLNPTIFSLLGHVAGKTILDAGCGQGYLSRMLARKGARVTGIEPAETWFNAALDREQVKPLGITYLQADLSSWAYTPQEFDYVIANMVFMDIPNYIAALQHCVEALKPKGGLIFSILHPCFEEAGKEWKNKGFVEVRSYFQEQTIKQDYGYFIHRQLSTYLNSVIQAGCIIQQVLEPQLDFAVAEQHDAKRYWCVPGYMVIYAIRAF